ncbi:hypothetical protein [Hymenobacter tibetensis]|uniref:hypothetical protein n=1 Tax=Hymenobacter tibetensis TaxID=497967 RepID=UPI00374D3AE1
MYKKQKGDPALDTGRAPAELIIYSDLGSQYTATRFQDLLARHGAQQSMSRRGNCYDNAHAESFWSRLKTELPSSTNPLTTSKSNFKPRLNSGQLN